MNKLKRLHAAFFACAFIAGCGGGGGGGGSGNAPLPPPAPNSAGIAEGAYTGTTADSRAITVVVPDDGVYYFFYSGAGNPTVVEGVVQGSGTVASNRFTSTNGRDFYFPGFRVNDATLGADVPGAKTSLNGTLTTLNFTSAYSSNYDAAPSLAGLAGTYAGKLESINAGRDLTNLSITAGGAITVTFVQTANCSLTGTATPRSRGNVYNVSLTYAATCPAVVAGQALTGVAYYTASSTTATQLLIAATNTGRTDAMMFYGKK